LGERNFCEKTKGIQRLLQEIVNRMNIYKIAITEEQNRKKIDAQEDDIKELKAKLRKAETEIKQLTKKVDEFNMGERQFFQQKSIFTSLQRKLERLEKVEQEWDKFKATIKDDIKSEIEKKTRSQVSAKSPIS